MHYALDSYFRRYVYMFKINEITLSGIEISD
jgi:hypothetical protein